MNGTIWQNMSIVNTSIKTGYITVTEPAPVANFNQNVTAGFYSLPVLFNDTSTNAPTAWNWSFGDGSLSTLQNVTHVYSSGGTYQVNLTVHNSNATYSSKLGSVEVWNYTTSTFSGTPVSGVVPLTVTFTDTSSNATNWSWQFGDTGTSIVKSPVYTYNTIGTYSVNHSANNTHDISWTNQSNYITVLPGLLAQYKPGQTVSIWYPTGIFFNDTSLGTPTSWNWTFGDGTNSTKQNPYKQWRAPGVYHVRLTETNAYETSSNSSWVQVMKWN
jgi:PKD repeat protein